MTDETKPPALQVGDTVDLPPGFLLGDSRRRRGVVTAIAADGMVTAEFPRAWDHVPMTLTVDAQFFIRVQTEPPSEAS